MHSVSVTLAPTSPSCPTQVNMVFDHLRETRNFSGYTLFLEEDHYVSPDFVVMAKKLQKLKEE